MVISQSSGGYQVVISQSCGLFTRTRVARHLLARESHLALLKTKEFAEINKRIRRDQQKNSPR